MLVFLQKWFPPTRKQCRWISKTLLLLVWGVVARGQALPAHSPMPDPSALRTAADSESVRAAKDLDRCRVHEIQILPGSHEFGSHFIEAIASDPNPRAKDRSAVWGLTADLSSRVSQHDHAMYLSKSIDYGKTWAQVARIPREFFDADIGEGERNGLGVSPGGTDFVITTQLGAFQVISLPGKSDAVVKAIPGPRIVEPDPDVTLPKVKGDPVTAGAVKITADGKHLFVSYGYFDLNPQIFSYHRARDDSWINDGPLPRLPTDMDILSMQFDDPRHAAGSSLYVGTGDQAFRLKSHATRWTRIEGVGDDSAIQSISLVGGPHLAACWGVYNPINADRVERVTQAHFLLHREDDEVGSSIRAFSVEVDPSRPNRQIVASLTGVYTSNDRGKTWKRLNDLPDEEFRSAHFNADGTVIVSGIAGAFLANPFSNACTLHLRARTP